MKKETKKTVAKTAGKAAGAGVAIAAIPTVLGVAATPTAVGGGIVMSGLATLGMGAGMVTGILPIVGGLAAASYGGGKLGGYLYKKFSSK